MRVPEMCGTERAPARGARTTDDTDNNVGAPLAGAQYTETMMFAGGRDSPRRKLRKKCGTQYV